MFTTFFGVLISTVFAASFESGNTRYVYSLEGKVKIQCQEGQGGHQEQVFTCRDRIMEPAPYDYFRGPDFKDNRRLKLELHSVASDKSKRTKISDYRSVDGRSTDRVNLWISNLFQKPLLKIGSNEMIYKLVEYGGGVVTEGTFHVDVVLGAPRRCPDAEYHAIQISDCNSPYTICQRYFTEFNNCKE